MNALYDVSAFTIRKYTYVVCDVLSNGDKLFSVYVHTLTRDWLFNIIKQFHDITSLQQIYGEIDGTHIPLSVKPNKQITSSVVDFYNRKCFHSILLQVVCDCDFFWNACTGQPGGVANRRQFKMSNVSFFSIKIGFAKTNCYYWRCANSTLLTWGCNISYSAIPVERLQTSK